MTAYPRNAERENDSEELARVHDLAFEMLSILESINRNTYVTENAIGAGLASRINRVIKEAHGG